MLYFPALDVTIGSRKLSWHVSHLPIAIWIWTSRPKLDGPLSLLCFILQNEINISPEEIFIMINIVFNKKKMDMFYSLHNKFIFYFNHKSIFILIHVLL